jgi:hypothetical protein
LLHEHLAIEPVAIPPTRPVVPHNRGKPQPTPKVTRVKSDASKLSGEGTLRPHKLSLLILVVQLIVLSEDICSRMVLVRSNSPDKLTDLDDSFWHQLMQLYSELMQDVHKNRMWGHVKPSIKEILEYYSFIHPRLRHIPHARRSAISHGKIVTVVSEGPEAGFHHSRLPKIISDTS